MSANNSPAWFLRKSSKAAKLQPETRLYSERIAQPKHEHEWASRELDDLPMRVRRDGKRWIVEYYGTRITSDKKAWIPWPTNVGSLAAEIARLAGLTEPEGEGR